jgi:dTDP-glucose 4,6-dehydratase
VDLSIDAPSEFMNTNIIGSYQLLEQSLKYFEKLSGAHANAFRYIHISTDEVFGSLGIDDPAFNSETPYDPKSPYSASKAASDHLARAWGHTNGLPVIVTNCSNNYGPYQFPEKLIPLMIFNMLNGQELPIYGTGSNIRDWLYVEDHCEAIWQVLQKGRIGETYLIGGEAERTNKEIVSTLCSIVDEIKPKSDGGSYSDLITYVTDRPGHDFRYAINISKIRKEIGWSPSVNIENGLRKTVEWYISHQNWWQDILDGTYSGERLGLGREEKAGDT